MEAVAASSSRVPGDGADSLGLPAVVEESDAEVTVSAKREV